MLIPFPKRRHAILASAGSANPNRAGGASLPIGRKASAKIINLSEGMRPRSRQLLTAGSVTPAIVAAAVVPPTASITSSTVSSMTPEYSPTVNKSSLHNAGIVTPCEFGSNVGMSRSLKDIARRLKVTQDALDLTGAQIARDTTISANEWSQYLNPAKYKRKISTDDVLQLKDEYGVTLEWVYDGDISSLPDRVAAKIRQKMAA